MYVTNYEQHITEQYLNRLKNKGKIHYLPLATNEADLENAKLILQSDMFKEWYEL